MKKVLIAAGIAALAFASVASAQGTVFSTNLTVGSTGSDVVALQTWLIANGFDIPSISSGAAAKGYFGAQTKSAVQKYQASKGIPSTGFVGPLTRAALNAGGTASTGGSTAVACPVGFICQPVGGTTPVTGAPTGITTPGIGGTLAVSLQGSPSGASLDKGESEDVARYKLQAASSDMQVTSIAVDFDVRLWLYASAVTIKDDAGTVIATKSNLTANDFTELTVGSSYRLYVPVNYVVPKTASRFVTVNVTMLPISDRSSATITVGQVQVRSVDGTGVTDTQTETTDRTFSYTGSNSGTIVVTVDAASPLKRLVQISNSAITQGVVIAVVDVKSQNRDATLRTLKVYVKTDGTSVNTLFNRFKVKAGNLEYTANTINTSSPDTTSSSTVTFTDMTIPLPKDQYVPITILADIAQPASTGALDGKSASTTLVVNTTNVAAEDSTYNTVSVNSTTLVSSDLLVSASSAVLSNLTATLGAPIMANQTTVGYPITMSFTLTAGDNTLYISGKPTVALSTSSSGITTASSSLTVVTPNPGEISGDASDDTYFVVPAGSSRTFSWAGSLNNTNGTTGAKVFQITGVTYNTSTSGSGSSTINYNLDALKVTPTF